MLKVIRVSQARQQTVLLLLQVLSLGMLVMPVRLSSVVGHVR